jgi:DNA-binding transcriptional LysR family regulator
LSDDPYDVIDLKALKCFWAVARLGSMTKAGLELGISEFAISQRLKALEAHVGSKLYETPGGRVRLTFVGEQAMEMAVSLFDRIAEFEREVGKQTTGGSVTIATLDLAIRYMLPDVVRQYTRDHPDVQLRIISRPSASVVEMVRQGEVDAGIISGIPKEYGGTTSYGIVIRRDKYVSPISRSSCRCWD